MKLNRNGLIILLLTCMCLPVTDMRTAWAGSAIPATQAPARGKTGTKVDFSKVAKLPDLTITRIHAGTVRGEQRVWIELANMGGTIPADAFQRASLRFSYRKMAPIEGTLKHHPQSMVKKILYYDPRGLLRQPGGRIELVAPQPGHCSGPTELRVEVDIPLAGKGVIRESNEQNNRAKITITCP